MDWGLFRSPKESGKKFLRDKILFPKRLYYFAIGANTILRLIWILQVVPALRENPHVLLSILGLAEGFRRMMWTLLRVENENVNNFERYRNVLMIPAIKEDYEEDEKE